MEFLVWFIVFFFGFVESHKDIFGVLSFAPIQSSLSLEIQSTPWVFSLKGIYC